LLPNLNSRLAAVAAAASSVDAYTAWMPGFVALRKRECTLRRRRDDILAFFDRHAHNSPTEAINRRLEALRRNALGFRNLTHYRWRSLLHSGALNQLVNAF
jgi:transposase